MPFKADFDPPGHVKPALQHGKKILESAHLLGNWRNRGRLLHGAGLMSLLDSVFLDSKPSSLWAWSSQREPSHQHHSRQQGLAQTAAWPGQDLLHLNPLAHSDQKNS
jgi:hypothetical protein